MAPLLKETVSTLKQKDYVHNLRSSTIDALDNVSIIIKNVNDITGNGYLDNNTGSIIKGNNVSIEADSYVHNIRNSTIEADNVSIISKKW